MVKNKYLKEYIKKYNDIPNDYDTRVNYLLDDLNIKDKDLKVLNEKILKIHNTKFNQLSFVFYFNPEATPRARSSRFTHAFYVKTKMNYNDVFGQFISTCDPIKGIIDTPCKFYTRLFIETPKGMNRIEKVLAELMLIPHITNPDWDNLGKTYSDMVQKHLILNDSLIYDGRVTKFYSIKPRVEIYIEYLNDYGSDYNRRKINSWLFSKNHTTSL
jgi:Holliday junction resolvase RusA-like endonuclease